MDVGVVSETAEEDRVGVDIGVIDEEEEEEEVEDGEEEEEEEVWFGVEIIEPPPPPPLLLGEEDNFGDDERWLCCADNTAVGRVRDPPFSSHDQFRVWCGCGGRSRVVCCCVYVEKEYRRKGMTSTLPVL